MMAEYTITLGTYCQNLTKIKNPYNAISAAAPSIFNFPITYYNPSQLSKFEEDFLLHFFSREIGAETPELWKLYLRDHFNTVLPFYNRLWSAIEKDYDFLFTDDFQEVTTENETADSSMNESGNSRVDSTTEGTGNAKTETQDTSSTQNKSTMKHSTTPQSSIENLENGTYMDEAQITDTNGTTTSQGNTNTNTENSATTNGTTDTERQQEESRNRQRENTITRKGRQGQSPAVLMREYMDAVRNVTEEFYKSCEVLFMQIY